MFLVDEYYNVYLKYDTNLLNKHVDWHLYKNVLEINRITQKQYTTSINYYINNPTLYKVFLDSLLVLAEQEKKYNYEKYIKKR